MTIDEKALEAAAKAVFECHCFNPDKHPWVEGGNSFKQQDARRLAIAALESALPPAGEVGELVKRLITDLRTDENERAKDEMPGTVFQVYEDERHRAADALTALSARLAEAERLVQQRESELAAAFRDDDKMKLLEKYRRDLDTTTARLERAEAALIRARTILGNMAQENQDAVLKRWPIHHEPLRADARALLPEIDAALSPAPAGGEDGWRQRLDDALLDAESAVRQVLVDLAHNWRQIQPSGRNPFFIAETKATGAFVNVRQKYSAPASPAKGARDE
jgi:hypothetical protein